MRVTAEHHFYIDYLLPRPGGEEDLPGVTFDAVKWEAQAKVYVRQKNQPIFADEPSKNLKTAFLDFKSVDDPEIAGRHYFGAAIIDRITVRLEWDANFEDLRDVELQHLWLRRATQLANHYIRHCRTTANAPLAHDIPRYWKPEDTRISLRTPCVVNWFDAVSGEPLDLFGPGLNGAFTSPSYLAPVADRILVDKLMNSLASTHDPVIHHRLLVDAQEQLMRVQPDQAIVTAGTACEVAAETLATRQSHARADLKCAIKNTIANKKTSFAQRYFDALPRVIGAEPLHSINLEAYQSIERMYRERNLLVHRGIWSKQLSLTPELDVLHIVHTYLAGCGVGISYLDSIVSP